LALPIITPSGENFNDDLFSVFMPRFTVYEFAMKTIINYPSKHLSFIPRILKFHGFCTHEISAMPRNYHGNLIRRCISWPMKQLMAYHELTFMVYFIG